MYYKYYRRKIRNSDFYNKLKDYDFIENIGKYVLLIKVKKKKEKKGRKWYF